MSTIALVVLSNGRPQLLDQAMASLAHLEFEDTLVCDDSGDPEFGELLQVRFPWAVVDAHPHLGHGPAMARAWQRAATLEADHVLWWEEDMIAHHLPDLHAIAGIVEAEGLAQMVFKRGAHFPAEVEAGGMLERFGREPFAARETAGLAWMEHRLFYSLNPNLVSTRFLARHRWPAIPNSEHHFGRQLFRDRQVKVGMYGTWEDEPVVEHAGVGPRTGTGY